MGDEMTDDSWDEWFDDQQKLTDRIRRAVTALSEGRGDGFRVALYSAVIESAAEAMRAFIPASALTGEVATGEVAVDWMRWGVPDDHETPLDLAAHAELIVEWINLHGGKAWYEPAWYSTNRSQGVPDRIVITGPNGPIYAEPGDTIVMGSVVGVGPVLEYRIHEDSGMDLPVYASTLREFTVRSQEPTPMNDELAPSEAVTALREAIYTVLGDDCTVAETDAIIDLALPAVVHSLVDELAAQAKQDDAQIREANRMLASLRAELAEARAEIERLMGINKGLVRDFNTMLVSNSKAETARDGLRHQREVIRAALDKAVSEMECIRADRQTDYATGAVSGAQRARVRVLAVLARSDSVGGTE